MGRPTSRDWDKLRRLAKHFMGKPRFVHRYREASDRFTLCVYTGANLASDKVSRRNTSGGAIMMGGGIGSILGVRPEVRLHSHLQGWSCMRKLQPQHSECNR